MLADGVDIRIIQLMLGHASIQQTQRYLNITDEELRRGLGELEQQRPTASTRGRSVRCSTTAKKNDRPNALSHICHTGRSRSSKFGCGGVQPAVLAAVER